MSRKGNRVGAINKNNFMYSPFVLLLAKKHPQAYDAIYPHGPKFSIGAIDVLASQILKSISQSLANRQTGKALGGLAKQLYSGGVSVMSYDDDNFCGTPYPLPHHIYFDPQPVPWFTGVVKQDKQALQNYYGGVISIVAQVVSDDKIASALDRISKQLIG